MASEPDASHETLFMTDPVQAPRPDGSLPEDLEQKAMMPRMDGGYHAWATMAGGCLAVIASFGYSNSFGVYQDLYTRTTSHSSSSISWIGSVQFFITLIMSFPAGKLLERGLFRWVVATGTLIYVFSLFMLSLAHPAQYYQIFLSQGIGAGLGAGLIYAPAMAVQAHHWQKNRALAMGVVASGTSVGGVLFSSMLNRLFQGSLGYAWSVRVSAFVTLGLLIISNALMTPQVMSRGTHLMPSTSSLFADVPYMAFNFGLFLISWGLLFPYFYLQLYAISNGVSSGIAFYTIAILNAAAVPGRIVPNWIADKLGSLNTLIPMCFCSGVLLVSMLGVKSMASTIVFALLYGFFSGSYFSLLPSATASMSKNPAETGVRMGMSLMLASFGPLTGSPICGAILGTEFVWFKPIAFSTIVVFAGTIFLAFARFGLVRRDGVPTV